jgi:hypothetical protein
MRHNHMLFESQLIDVPTWDQADWRGVLYMAFQTGEQPPVLGLFFNNEAPARRIFRDWRTRFGACDDKDAIRVAIIEGEVPGFRPGYFLHLTPNIDLIAVREETQLSLTASPSNPQAGQAVTVTALVSATS